MLVYLEDLACGAVRGICLQLEDSWFIVRPVVCPTALHLRPEMDRSVVPEAEAGDQSHRSLSSTFHAIGE